MVDDGEAETPSDRSEGDGDGDESVDFVASEDRPPEVIPPGQWQGPGPGSRPGGAGEPSSFMLEVPDFWSTGLFVLFGLLAIPLIQSVLPGLWAGESPMFWGGALVLEVLIAAGALAYRVYKLPSDPRTVELSDDGAVFPAGADSTETYEVAYTDVRAVMIMRRGQSEWVMIETDDGRVGYAAESFRRPDGARRLHNALMSRIRRHPRGEAILERMRRLERTAEAASANGTPITYTLLAVISGIFLYEYTSGALASEFGLLDLGAISAALIEEGQYFRLVSGSFLHGGFVHILFNGLALLFLGVSIERMLGSWRFLLIFLISAIGGATGSYLWTEAPLAVGSSTALYGLIGAFGVLHLRYWSEIPPPYRQTVKWWAVIMVLNVGISMLPVIDAAAHFAGMGVGVAATYAVCWPMSHLDPTDRAGVAVRVVTALLTALFAAGLARASNYAAEPHPTDRSRVAAYEVEHAKDDGDHRRLNRLAWRAATKDGVTVAELKVAQSAVESALDRKPDALNYLDTLATVLYRLAETSTGDQRRKRLSRAIELERRALREGEPVFPWFRETLQRWASYDPQVDVDPSVYWTQIGRFLETYREDFGVYRPGGDGPEVVSLGRAAAGAEVRLGGPAPAETELVALVVGGDGPAGVTRFCVPRGKSKLLVGSNDAGWVETELPAGAEFRLAMVDSASSDCDGSTAEFWSWNDSIDALP